MKVKPKQQTNRKREGKREGERNERNKRRKDDGRGEIPTKHPILLF